jgi:hypothetical protein
MIFLLLISPMPHAIVIKTPTSATRRKIEAVPQVAVHTLVVAKMITTIPETEVGHDNQERRVFRHEAHVWFVFWLSIFITCLEF